MSPQIPRFQHGISLRNTSSMTSHILGPGEDKFTLPILTPNMKVRKTAKLVLKNGMKCFLVSDPLTPTSGAALSVETGSWRDEKRFEGTAHFLEHMLFLGTEKFPGESDYERYITDNNGNMNAYTSSDHSLYYFEITPGRPGALEGALDRFSEFFKRPLFNDSCVDREMNAVDQEFRKNIESDGWRLLHVRKELADQSHPFSFFNTGNLETMKLIDPAVLKDWYAKYYSANIMNFAIVGREPLDEMIRMVEKYMNDVPNKNASPVSTQDKVFGNNVQGQWIYVEPLKDLRELNLTWEIPKEFANEDSKPASLLAHVLGHEGEGSLLTLLKSEHLVESLSAGKSELGAGNNLFEISVSLTEPGFEQRNLVVERIFQAIASLKAAGEYPRYIYDELQNMGKTQYSYQQRTRGAATNLAGSMRKESLETFPYKTLFVSEFDPKLINQLLNRLTPQSCFVTLLSKQVEEIVPLDKQEKWMKAKYAVKPFSSEELTVWSNAQALPEIRYPDPNPFIPEHLKLVTEPEDNFVAPEPFKTKPTLVTKSEKGVLYHHLDDEFFVPQSDALFCIKTPAIRPDNAKSLAMADLYLRFVHERLNELAYPAHYAGLGYDVWVHQATGIALSVSGYSEKSNVLLDAVLQRLKNPTPDQPEFDIFKESLLRDYKNAELDPPLRQAFTKASSMLYKDFCSPADMAEAIQGIEMKDLIEWIQTLYSRTYVEAFVGGNVTNADALATYNLVRSSLGGQTCPLELVQRSRVIDFQNDRPLYLFEKVNVKGNAVVWMADCGLKTHYSRTAVELLAKLLKEPFYTELRTVQQTGYMVHSGHMMAGNKRLFLQASVQSNSHDARDLLARIELFMETFVRDLPKMEDRFASLKESILERLKSPYENMSGKNKLYNMLAYEENAEFDLIPERIRELENFTFADLVEFGQKTLGRGNKNRLAVLLQGNDPENVGFSYEAMESIDGFKAKL